MTWSLRPDASKYSGLEYIEVSTIFLPKNYLLSAFKKEFALISTDVKVFLKTMMYLLTGRSEETRRWSW